MGNSVTDVVGQFREYIRLDRKNRGDGLDPVEIERWSFLKRKLGKEFAPDLSDARSDERASVRVPTRLRVDFASESELRGQLMTNLSRGGLFVATDYNLPIGSRVELAIHVGPDDRTLQVSAEVVSHNVGPHFEPASRGMGLRFLETDEATQHRLEDLYERSLHAAAPRRKAE
jgi:uncharacterized protein (TIGR02266 family)